jgi:hypothetical protein
MSSGPRLLDAGGFVVHVMSRAGLPRFLSAVMVMVVLAVVENIIFFGSSYGSCFNINLDSGSKSVSNFEYNLFKIQRRSRK